MLNTGQQQINKQGPQRQYPPVAASRPLERIPSDATRDSFDLPIAKIPSVNIPNWLDAGDLVGLTFCCWLLQVFSVTQLFWLTAFTAPILTSLWIVARSNHRLPLTPHSISSAPLVAN
jgi:hypothetical protein